MQQNQLQHGSSNLVGAQSYNTGMTSSQMADQSKAVAEIQSAMAIAKRFPRNEIDAIERIKRAFQRTGLAELSQYRFAKGGTDVSGPSIRSAEAVAQNWGNIEFGFRETARGIGPDGVPFSEVQAYAWDIESNTKRPATFIVKHWRDTKKGGYVLKDEREIYELTANMAQRRVRACILAVIPGDVFDTAMDEATKTLKASADVSPEGIQKLLSAFKTFNVTKDQIEKRIQRKIDAIQPGQVVSLKQIYVSLRDGMSEPSEWFDTDESDPTKSRANLAALSDAEFNEKLAPFKPALENGSASPDSVIAKLSTIASLSDEQVTIIRAFKKREEVQQTNQQESADQGDWFN